MLNFVDSTSESISIAIVEDRLKWIILLSEAIYSRDDETYLGMFTDRGNMVESSLIAMDINIWNDWYCKGDV